MNDTGHVALVCENCSTALQGHYCHVCGQSTVNPIRDVGHAFEEVLESFWHLDGRIWRTLRDLISPGRVAVNYLAGHRARYVAPLRLFLVLSLVTFFVAQFTVRFDSGPQINDHGVRVTGASFDKATSVAEVEKLRDARVSMIRRMPFYPGGSTAQEAAIREIAESAAKRARSLQPDAVITEPPDATQVAAQPEVGQVLSINEKAWDEKTNPWTVSWLPAFANAWINRQIAHVQENLPRIRKDPELLKHAILSAVPTVLFILVPVFAFLLKVAYMRQRRLYLEHLVVALYSHAFLLLVLLTLCLSVSVGAWLGTLGGWLEWAAGWLWLWIPIYLWLMQKRVYRQGGFVTTLKFLQMGVAYTALVLVGTVLAFFIGLVKV